MNLNKLFEIQAKLDERIIEEHGLQGEDLLDKKILALQVELGELANEWRGFKFWSKDQEPRTNKVCEQCEGHGTEYRDSEINGPHGIEYHSIGFSCRKCKGSGDVDVNPLLEEYVDCLHFVLSIGLSLNVKADRVNELYLPKKMPSITDHFLWTNKKLLVLYENISDGKGSFAELLYLHLFNAVIGLVEMLGFTWEQIEQAYLDKNKINHERQNNGY